MARALIRKLEHFCRLSVNDRDILNEITSQSCKTIPPHHDLIAEGERPTSIYLVLRGWACSYKSLPDGRRQIVAFLLPGDMCERNIFIVREMDYSIEAITRLEYAEISRASFERMADRHPRIVQALRWETLRAASIQREWMLSLGQRNGYERVAHLLCELFIRLHMTGHVTDDRVEFPVVQADLADAVGLSKVHVNRVLQNLRADGLIVLKDRTLRVPNIEALKETCTFNPTYLHLGRVGAHLDAND